MKNTNKNITVINFTLDDIIDRIHTLEDEIGKLKYESKMDYTLEEGIKEKEETLQKLRNTLLLNSF